MEKIKVKIVREANTIAIPEYATPGAAGVDLCSTMYCMIKPGEQALISTGINNSRRLRGSNKAKKRPCS